MFSIQSPYNTGHALLVIFVALILFGGVSYAVMQAQSPMTAINEDAPKTEYATRLKTEADENADKNTQPLTSDDN